DDVPVIILHAPWHRFLGPLQLGDPILCVLKSGEAVLPETGDFIEDRLRVAGEQSIEQSPQSIRPFLLLTSDGVIEPPGLEQRIRECSSLRLESTPGYGTPCV